MKPDLLIFTGGHHTSGLAVAQKLSNIKIVWFGHRHSSWGDSNDSAEYKEVTMAGYKFINLYAGKFHRTFNPLKLIRIPWGFIQSLYLLALLQRKYNIRGIVSFGGYLAVPVVISGWLLGIKSITHEQTLVSGWANRVISKFSVKIGLSWPQSQKYFPKSKSVVVGLPIRQEILDFKSTTSSHILYITGGKQGSHIINSIILECLPSLLEKYTVIHQTGSNSIYGDFDQAKNLRNQNYFPIEYTDSLTTAKNLQQASIIISRSGAHIIAEILYLQKPAVLIPIPWGSHNEQQINAEFLVSQNLAVILLQDQLTPENLLKSITEAENLKPIKNNFNFHGLSNFATLITHEFLQEN